MTSGLVLVTSPFCFTACAQDYVDVEAERGATTTPASPATAAPEEAGDAGAASGDGSAPTPPPGYGEPAGGVAPATSYSIGGDTAGPAATSPPPSTVPQAVPAGAAGGMGSMFNQVQQLRQEVMLLNGRVEELSNELNQLKSQSLERYRDLDQRLSGGAAVGPGQSGGAPAEAVAGGGAAAMGTADEIPGEADAYRAAYALVRGQSFAEAVDAFNQFLQDYPDGKYAPNAHYWLGELHLVTDPPDPESSRQSFSLLLSEYPDNPKAPDAMFKLGKVYYLKGNRAKSREYLDRVISEYGDSNSSAVQMARDFIDQNF